MPPTKPGHHNLNELRQRLGTHHRVIVQHCRYYGIPLVPSDGGGTIFVADEHLPMLAELVARWNSDLERHKAIMGCRDK